MIDHKLGDILNGTFHTLVGDGTLTDADVLPTGTVVKNGSIDALVVTVVKLSTGYYYWFCDPSGFAAGDRVSIEIDATISSIVSGATMIDVEMTLLSIDDLINNFFTEVIDGTGGNATNLKQSIKELVAVIVNKCTMAGDDYPYRNKDDDATVITHSVTDGGRIVS